VKDLEIGDEGIEEVQKLYLPLWHEALEGCLEVRYQ